MSVRLYPEIFVMSEVLDQMKKNQLPVIIDINDCLKLQKELNYSPSLHIFTSPIGSNKDWGIEDYKDYLLRTHCFCDHLSTKWELLQCIFKNEDEYRNIEKAKVILRKHLLIDGAYSGITMAALGLK